MQNISIQFPDTLAIEQENGALVAVAERFSVVSDETARAAGEHLRGLRAAKKAVQEAFAEPKRLAHEAHKAITSAEKRLLEPITRAEADCAGKVSLYLAEVQRQEREALEKARREAEEVAAAEEARLRKLAEDERVAVAARLESEGRREEAEEMISAPVVVEPVIPAVCAPPPAERLEGIHTRTTWTAQVADLRDLVRAVASGEQPISLLQPDMVALNKLANALKTELRIPGVRVVERSSVVTRA